MISDLVTVHQMDLTHGLESSPMLALASDLLEHLRHGEIVKLQEIIAIPDKIEHRLSSWMRHAAGVTLPPS